MERAFSLKKKIVVCFALFLMAFSFMVLAMAEAPATEPMNIDAEHEIVPFSEMTRIYWRVYQGNVQMRVWGMTSGRWLTDWVTVPPA